MRWRIRQQLLFPLLILLLGVVGISTWTGFVSAQRARQAIESQVRDIARTVQGVTFPRSRQTLLLMRGLAEAEFLLDDGQENFITTFDISGRPTDLPKVEDAAEELHLGPLVRINGNSYFCNGIRLRHGGRPDSTLFIFYPESLWQDALWDAIRPSLILGVFGGLAALALAVGVAQRLSRRIQELERRTRQIAEGDFSPMPLPGRDDELRDLGHSVNDMAQRLAQLQETVLKTERFRLLGQVSGGLAHQLRNSVAGARLAVQLHAKGCDSQAEPEALDVALRQLKLVEANLKRFLDLGHATGLDRQPHAVAGLLQEAITLLQPQCRHNQIDLRWLPPAETMTVLGDAGQLGQLFLNVIGNGIEAAGPGGWVSISIISKHSGQTEDSSAQAIIDITDSGPGPPPEIAHRLFEPFVTGKREGIGLGLAVARQVAQAHGGTIEYRRENNATCFRIVLPLQDTMN